MISFSVIEKWFVTRYSWLMKLEATNAIRLWHDAGEPTGREMFPVKGELVDIVVENRMKNISVDSKSDLGPPIAF